MHIVQYSYWVMEVVIGLLFLVVQISIEQNGKWGKSIRPSDVGKPILPTKIFKELAKDAVRFMATPIDKLLVIVSLLFGERSNSFSENEWEGGQLSCGEPRRERVV